MRSKKTNTVVGVALLVALTVAGALPMTPARGAENSDAQARKLEGTWRVRVTTRDCQSGAEQRTFPAMLTFARGGTLTETTAGFPPAARTPGHGIWRHEGGHTYSAVSEAFLFSPAGAWVGTQRLTQSIEIGGNPDELTSTATNEIFDTGGNLLTSGCATAEARRFE
jgi:hypothetical protein